MSMTIETTHGVNELQLQAMLTGQLKEATHLEGWEAFKNFFIKLLNHLPGMNLEDKEKKLLHIYNTIYGEETAAARVGPHSIETLWPAVVRLIQLMDGDHVRAMEFEISHNVPDMAGDMNLVIRVDGHTLPEIALSGSAIHLDMLSSVLNHHMILINDKPGVFQLDPEKLISQEKKVKLADSAVMVTSHGFTVARALEASREQVNKPVEEISNPDAQKAQLNNYQPLIADLEKLRTVQVVGAESYIKCIDDALALLKTHWQQQLKCFQQLNHKFVESLVDECATDLVQGGLMSEKAIKTINTKVSYFIGMDVLFNKVDRESLKSIKAQLKLASLVANLQKHIQPSKAFPQQLYLQLQIAMREAKAGPLTPLLKTAYDAIRQVSPRYIAEKQLEAQAQQLSGNWHEYLDRAEANMAILLSNPQNKSNVDSKKTKKMVAKANCLSVITPDRGKIIIRAQTFHQQNVAITEIDRLLSEVQNVAKEERDRVIPILQELNAQLPESQRKSSYQQQIDKLK